jgi:hypothetical protein
LEFVSINLKVVAKFENVCAQATYLFIIYKQKS